MFTVLDAGRQAMPIEQIFQCLFPINQNGFCQVVTIQVKKVECDTLMYMVHLPARSPLDQGRVQPPSSIPLPEQTEVVFVEIYKSAEAFKDHLNGVPFTEFRKQNMQYFCEDPQNPGWPDAKTEFLDRQSAFIREEAG